MPDYRIRPATLDDVDALVRHRIAMFSDMGTTMDRDVVAQAFRGWLTTMLPAGTYRGWVVEAAPGEIVAGGGMTILPWPPGPRDVGGRMAFVYNVYTEPAHRRQGLARMIMDAVHGWCRNEGIGVAGLNASPEAQRLYESMGYQKTPTPMMVAPLAPVL